MTHSALHLVVNPPGAQLVTRVHRGAPAISEPAARLHTRAARHPGARAADPRALRPDGGVRGLDRDPQPHCWLAAGTPQQLRALAALREAPLTPLTAVVSGKSASKKRRSRHRISGSRLWRRRDQIGNRPLYSGDI